MTFLEMQTELSEAIAESGVKTFSLAARKNWLNLGVLHVCARTLVLWKKITKNITAGTATHDIKDATGTNWGLTDFLEFHKAGIVSKDSATEPNTLWSTLDRQTVEWLDENLQGWRMTDSSLRSDTLQYYAREGMSSVVFWPVPKTAVTNGFVIYYHYVPVQTGIVGGLIANADIPFDGVLDLYPYHHLPVMYATYRALFKAGVPKAEKALQEYAAELRNMKVEMRREPDREPRLRVGSYRAR